MRFGWMGGKIYNRIRKINPGSTEIGDLSLSIDINPAVGV